jgi:hypothetical protein
VAVCYSRSQKQIDLSPEIKAMLGLTAQKLTPGELITAILKCQADLLWFGGIGTYVKARAESHADAGDKANDAIRISADQLAGKGGWRGCQPWHDPTGANRVCPRMAAVSIPMRSTTRLA